MATLFNSGTRTFFIKDKEGNLIKFLPKTTIKVEEEEQLNILLKFKEITKLNNTNKIVLNEKENVIKLEEVGEEEEEIKEKKQKRNKKEK